MKKTILIIEDDRTISDELSDALGFFDFKVERAFDGIKGYRRYSESNPDLIILDVMLPGIDGFEVCRKIRQSDPVVPIVMLTAKALESDKLLGFELGVDDYVVKPFSLKELVARVKAILKRSEQRGKSIQSEAVELAIGKGTVDFKNFTILKRGKAYKLTPKENCILRLFAEKPNEVISRERIIDEIWGEDAYPSPRSIDNAILKFRSILEENPKKPKYFITVHGAGYKLSL